MATIKDLKEVYRIGKLPSTKEFLVYDKRQDSGRRCVFKYLCSLTKKNNKFSIVGTDESYSNINDIKDAISKYVDSLEFDSEYYDPSWRNGLFEEMIIHDYLSERGFESQLGWDRTDTIYVLKEDNIYLGNTESVVLIIDGIGAADELPEEVKIKFKTGDYSWVEDSCKRNVDDIKKTISSLMKPYFLSESVRNVKHADNYTEQEFKATINKLDANLNKFSADYKSELKEKLEKMIAVL